MSAIIAYGGTKGTSQFGHYFPLFLQLANQGVQVGISMLAKVKSNPPMPTEEVPAVRVEQLRQEYPYLANHPKITFIDQDTSRDEVLGCEVLFEPGGSPAWLAHRFIDRLGISKQDLQSKILIVDSAGTILLFSHILWEIDAGILPGLNILPGIAIPHYEAYLNDANENTAEMVEFLSQVGYSGNLLTMNEGDRFVLVDPSHMNLRQMQILRFLYPRNERKEGELAIVDHLLK